MTTKFFKHFGLAKPKPNLEFLTHLTKALSHLPYENATKIIKKSEKAAQLRLPEELFEDYLQNGTGGTCFSLTFFFHEILKTGGFASYPVMADRSYSKNSHCALIVDLDSQKYLIDPGFLIDQPILLTNQEHSFVETSFNTLDLVWNINLNAYDIHTIHLKNRKWRYRIWMKGVDWKNFSLFWSDSFQWSGLNNVVITKIKEGKQFYLRDRHLRIIGKDKIVRKTIEKNDLTSLQTFLNFNPLVLKKAYEVTQS